MSEFGKIPPQAIDLEEIVLGSIMTMQELKDKIHEVQPEFFYLESHQLIFKSIQELHSKRNPVDIMTVTQQLSKDGNLELVGGAVYVTNLTAKIGSGSGFDYHLTVIKEKYILREVIRVSSEMENFAFADQDESIESCEEAINSLQKFIINNIIGDITGRYLYDLTEESQQLAAKRVVLRKENKDVGIPIPIMGIHEILGGWQNSDLVLIAARPSMGKTAVSVKFAKHVADRGYKTIFFSLEMSSIQLNDRAVLAEAGIDPEDWRNGDLKESDFNKIDQLKGKLRKWPFMVYDKASIRPDEVRAICKKEKPQIIFIDYIGLMKPNRGEKFQNKNYELAHVSHELKAIAKEMNIPVIAMAQLNRALDTRTNKIPVLSDLRDSGELEQDADIVMFIK